jgi:lactate dehydrogenase-like 2-hydroxyacid dehydrogenase
MLGIEMIVWMVLFIILGMIGSWVISIMKDVRELNVCLLMLSRKIEISEENIEWKEKCKSLEKLLDKYDDMIDDI